MVYRKYPLRMKERALQRMLNDENCSPTELARETGISTTTLWRWRKEALDPVTDSSKPTSPDKRSPDDKLRLVLAAEGLEAEQLGAMLRTEGVHLADLERWKEQMLTGLNHAPDKAKEQRQQMRKLKANNHTLRSELKRKDAALAETAALLALSKKARRLWGVEDDTTVLSNGDESSN